MTELFKVIRDSRRDVRMEFIFQYWQCGVMHETTNFTILLEIIDRLH